MLLSNKEGGIMIELKDGVDIKELEKFEFHSFKVNRLQTNYYRMFNHNCKVAIINNITREFYIDDWQEDDTRIHKVPKMKYKDPTTVEDCLVELAIAGLIKANPQWR